MDVGNIKPGGVGGRDERVVEITRPKQDSRKHHKVGDSATISHDSRETLNKLHDLSEKARQAGPDRQARVDAAAARLASGELDTPEVYRRVADSILGEA